VTLNSGRVEFYYTQMYGGENDFSAGCIAEIHTDDGGKTWSEPTLAVANDPRDVNIMSVSVLRLMSGKIAMFYCLKKSEIEVRPMMRLSYDEGRTWSDAKAVVSAPGPGVDYEICNDRAIENYRGRIYLPVCCNRVVRGADTAFGGLADGAGASIDWRGILIWYYSDDDGRNWQESPTWWTLPSLDAAGKLSPNGLEEPGIVELADGSLFSWARTDQGVQYGCIGHDEGNVAVPIFSEPQPTELKSPFAPANIKRIPDSADLLGVWDDHSGRFPYFVDPKDNIKGRAPLVVGLSQDGGKTWPIRKLIEGDIHGEFSYAAIAFVGGDVLIAYNAEDKTTPHLGTLRIRRVSMSWLRQP
jgi:Neuraminidase (sialidase)